MKFPITKLMAVSALAAVLITSPVCADAPPSLLPVFGTEGEEFSNKAEKGHTIHGWLPTGWADNSEWAPISASYAKLEDFPDDAFGAVRITLEKMDDGQLQLTSYAGERTYEKGKPYRVFGWLRSRERPKIAVIVRQTAEPYEVYYEKEVASGVTWKPFELNFQPAKDTKAIIMFAMPEVGTVDLAGVTVVQGGTAPSLLPVFGTEGAEFSTPAQKGNLVHGWLPNDWEDNSEWAPLSATYSRLEDPPAETFGAIRIKLEKLEEGQLQLTSWAGERTYNRGRTYQVKGWARSPDHHAVSIGVRQMAEPYELYHEGAVSGGSEWKPFVFTFQPAKEMTAVIMFVVKETGTVDLAGVTVTEKGAGE